jgi:hypothetical protein
MKKILLLVLFATVLGFTGLILTTGLGGPTHADIESAVYERLSNTIELSEISLKRKPKFVFSADQLILYTADATISEHYLQKLNPFTWQDRCEGGREGRTLNKELASTAVHEIVAKEGEILTLTGRMRAYQKDGEWAFTARSRRLMRDGVRISGTPESFIDHVLLTPSPEFDQLCKSVFVERD